MESNRIKVSVKVSGCSCTKCWHNTGEGKCTRESITLSPRAGCNDFHVTEDRSTEIIAEGMWQQEDLIY
jgi:hypothetical protein